MTAIDDIKLFKGEPIKITDKIILSQPKVQDIFKDLKTEQRFYQFVQSFTAITLDSSIIVFLTDKVKVDFTKISNWELFALLSIAFDQEISSYFFGDLDWNSMQPYNDENGNLYIENKDGVKITEIIYDLLFQYMRIINNMPLRIQTRILDDEVQKTMAITNARREVQSAIKKEGFAPSGSLLLPYISSLSNYCGLKSDEMIYNMNLYRFWDSVNRTQAREDCVSISYGYYSGNISLKDNPSLKKNLNWMRSFKNEH